MNRFVRGVGQAVAPQVPQPTGASAPSAPVGAQALMSIGGVAVVGGLVGAYASEEYGRDFAIASAVGLVLSIIGATWSYQVEQTAQTSASGTGGS